MTLRLLGIQIANGFSPEARVFAGLLAHTSPDAVKTQVLHHRWTGDADSLPAFQAASEAKVQALDFGWRSTAANRSLRHKSLSRLRFLAALPRALALARRFQPDVIYSCQQHWDCQAATYVARRLGVPQIIHLHYIVGPWLHKPVLHRLKTCAEVLTVSDFIREEALRHGTPPERVVTVRNAMTVPASADPAVRGDVRRELGIAPDAPLLGIVARLDPDKGQSDTLQAFARARAGFPAARLLVVGDETPWHPGYADKLKGEAQALGLGGSVLFLGRRADVPRLLAALDIFVHPSRQDPCPLALLEAAAAGLPVAAYAEGGANELIAEGQTGLRSAPGSVAGLSDSLCRLLADPAWAAALGQAGRARVEAEFRPEQAGERFEAAVRQAVSPRKGA